MIAENTVQAVQELDLQAVIGKYTKLDAKGFGNCPVHNEKTPSFSVSSTKGIYKCFGCGFGGNSPVSFVMEVENKSYPEAIEHLASMFHIAIEYDKDDEQAKKYRDMRKQIGSVAAWSYKKYSELRGEKAYTDWIISRGLTLESARYFDLAYAPDSWDFIASVLIEQAKVEEGIQLGIVAQKSGKTYDTLRDRILFPIHSDKGELLGYGGRTLGDNNPKYVNPPDSGLYSKSRVLYNLHRAKEYIRKADRSTYLVEGYMDAIALDQIGIKNVVASCGTALTLEQAKLLKRYASKVVLFYDGDQAGVKATLKATEILVRAGLKVSVLNIPFLDPDDYAKKLSAEYGDKVARHSKKQLQSHQIHAMQWVMNYHLIERQEYYLDELPEDLYKTLSKVATISEVADQTLIESRIDISEQLTQEYDLEFEATTIEIIGEQKSEAVHEVLRLLKLYDEVVRNEFLEKLKKLTSINKGDLNRMLKGVHDPEETVIEIESDQKRLPQDCDVEFLIEHQFAPIKGDKGYYFLSGGGYEKIGNFTLEPLYHILSEESQRFVKVRKQGKEMMLLMDSNRFNGPEQFSGFMWNKAGFVFSQGQRKHLDILKEYWADKFAPCYAIEQLGWQNEGFWAFSNKVYNGALADYSDIGIYKHENDSKEEAVNFLSPSKTEELEMRRNTESIYEHDKYLEFVTSKVSLKDWMVLFKEVYGDHAIYGLGFIFMTVFRDIALKLAEIPMLYNFGPTQAGKSSFSTSMLWLFFSGKDAQGKLMKPFQISTGTDFAFGSYLERFMNCPVVMNEFDKDSIDDRRMQAVKGIFDGEGRAKGSGRKNRTTTQKINASVVLVGQFLFVDDDMSIVNRSILRSFPAKTFTNQEAKSYEKLSRFEDQGLSSLITDILEHREEVKERYANRYGVNRSMLRDDTKKNKKAMSTRLINSYCHIYTFLEIMGDLIDIPYTIEEIKAVILDDMKAHNLQLTSGNALTEFWEKFENLVNVQKKIRNKLHFSIESAMEIPGFKKKAGDEWSTKTFDSPKNLLYIHLPSTSIQYSESMPSGRAMRKADLEKYLSEQDYYVGKVKNHTFSRDWRTSCMVFDYDKIDIQLILGEFDTPELPDVKTMNLSVKTDAVYSMAFQVGRINFKAGYCDAFGDAKVYNCYTTQVEYQQQILEGVELEVVGKSESKRFKPADSDSEVTVNKIVIEKIVEIRNVSGVDSETKPKKVDLSKDLIDVKDEKDMPF